MRSGWESRSLGTVLQKTETVNPRQSPDAQFDYIDVSSVSNTTFRIERTQRLRGADAPSRARRLVKANDVLFATVRPTLRRIAVVPESLDGQVCSTGYFVLRPNAEVDHRFLFYALFTEAFMRRMEELQKGASYPAVTDCEVRSQTIPVPPLSQQRRIVGILDHALLGITSAKANAERNRENARAVMRNHLQVVFERRGDGWGQEEQLGNLTELDSPITYGVLKPGAEGDVLLVRGGDVASGQVLTEHLRTITSEVSAQYRRTILRGGEVLITLVGEPGQVAVVPPELAEANIYRQVGLIRLSSRMNAEFVRFYLQSPVGQQALGARQSGSVQKVINLGEIRQVLVPTPPKEIQAQVAGNLLSVAEETKRLDSIFERKSTALENLKRALIADAFAGLL